MFKCIYLIMCISRESLVEPHVVNPIKNHKDPPNRIDQRHQGPHGRREQRQPAYYILSEYLKRQQEEVRSGRSHCVFVPSREPTQHVRQRQEQPYGGPNHHIHSEHCASVEDLRGGRGFIGARGGEGEAREGEEVGGREGWEGQVQEGHEATR